MDKLREAEKEAIMNMARLRALDADSLKKELIRITESNKLSLDDWEIFTVDGIPLPEHEQFKSKIPIVIALWRDILEKNKGKSQIKLNDMTIVPSKIVEVGEFLNSISDKDTLTKREVTEALNGYKALYESVIKLFTPHFISLHPDKKYLDWADIEKEFEQLAHYDKHLFKSMNGHLRNAEGHASFVAEDDIIVWMKEDGTRVEYPAKKIINKSIDLLFVIISLYYGLSEIFISHLVENYEKMSSEELKKRFGKVKFPEHG